MTTTPLTVPPSHIQTHSGRHLNPFDPQSAIEQITVDDIAHALSNKCRFTGHTTHFYSVAQHSVHVAEHLLHLQDTGRASRSPRLALMGLLHDAAEAYLPDVASPLKPHIWVFAGEQPHCGAASDCKTFTDAETDLQLTIYHKFGITMDDVSAYSHAVKTADLTLLATERRDLMTKTGARWHASVEAATPLPFTISPWSLDHARREFLREFEHLTSLIQELR